MPCASQQTGGSDRKAPECGSLHRREAGLPLGVSQVPRGLLRHRNSHSTADETVSSPASLWNKNKGEDTGGAEGGDKFLAERRDCMLSIRCNLSLYFYILLLPSPQTA